MKEILNNIYNGFLRFTPLRKTFRFASYKGTFPKLDFIDSEIKQNLEHTLGIRINHVEYFEQAFTHRSFLPVKNEQNLLSNERLEFLGDAVLNLVVADYLFSLHSNVDEGNLTKMRAQLVNKNSLAVFAKQIDLQSFIQLSYSAKKSIEDGSESIIADTTEAIIGAIYLDSGFNYATKFIINTIVPTIIGNKSFEDTNFKSKLLEYVQSKSNPAPIYKVISESGPDHDKEFTVSVLVNDKEIGFGKGKTKKQAEQFAAKDALENYFETINRNLNKS